MDKETNQTIQSNALLRIADALEEILRLVKLDQEAAKKRWEYEPNEDGFMGSENRIEK